MNFWPLFAHHEKRCPASRPFHHPPVIADVHPPGIRMFVYNSQHGQVPTSVVGVEKWDREIQEICFLPYFYYFLAECVRLTYFIGFYEFFRPSKKFLPEPVIGGIIRQTHGNCRPIPKSSSVWRKNTTYKSPSLRRIAFNILKKYGISSVAHPIQHGGDAGRLQIPIHLSINF